jgi:hypothetical protein
MRTDDRLARVGPTTPKRATTSLAASVDPTEARNARHDRDRLTREFAVKQTAG